MKYIVADISSPIRYQACGNLIAQEGFVHLRRTPDFFVLIVVQEGTLFITHGNKEYTLGPNQTILLFPGAEHFGHKPSEGYLSYYWVHFTFSPQNYRLYLENELKTYVDLWDASPDTTHTLKNFIIPETHRLVSDTRINLLFVQMLDFARRDNFSVTYRMHYSISLLILELTQECLSFNHIIQPEFPANLTEIIEWICANYEKDITVESLSRQYGYNPTYLSSLFKKHTGYPTIPYLNRFRIAVSKNLLVNRTLKIYTIARMCGFQDEKHYMKLFKRYESMTPSQYRIAFHQKLINQQKTTE